MKKLFLISFLLMLFFFGCTQLQQEKELPQNQEEFLLSLKFYEKQALIHDIKITNTSTKETIFRKSLTLTLHVFEDYAQVEAIILDATQIDANNNTINLCPSMLQQEKESIVKIYSDGAIDTGKESKRSIYLPRKKVKIGDKWDFEGLNYFIAGKEVVNKSFGSIEVLRITVNGRKDGRPIEGFILFDYKNGRLIQQVIKDRLGSTLYIIDTTLVDIKDNFNANDINKSCLLQTTITP